MIEKDYSKYIGLKLKDVASEIEILSEKKEFTATCIYRFSKLGFVHDYDEKRLNIHCGEDGKITSIQVG